VSIVSARRRHRWSNDEIGGARFVVVLIEGGRKLADAAAMERIDLLSAAHELGLAMAHAGEALGPEDFARLKRAALADAVGAITPLGLSAAQMCRIAERLKREAARREGASSPGQRDPRAGALPVAA
jgi:hypothetical protein